MPDTAPTGKIFSFGHRVFDTTETYVEDELPKWIRSPEHKWFLDTCVLTLNVGETVQADLHFITRIA